MQRQTSPEIDDSEESTVWPTLVSVGLTLSILAVVLGFLGWLHPAGDLIAVGRGHAVVAVLVLGIAASLLGKKLAAFWSILFALVAGTPVVLMMVFPGPPGTLTLYQKNLRFDNATLPALEEDIRAADPLVITLQEVSEANRALLDGLADRWPHQLVCPGGGVGGPAVASRLPPVEGATLCEPGLAAMQVVDDDRRFWIVSLHLHWPWPYSQRTHLRALLPVLAGLDQPTVIGGDFNMVPWSYTLGAVRDVTNTLSAGPSLGSYVGFAPLFWVPIDHVLAPGGGRARGRPVLGSDHMGILAEVDL